MLLLERKREQTRKCITSAPVKVASAPHGVVFMGKAIPSPSPLPPPHPLGPIPQLPPLLGPRRCEPVRGDNLSHSGAAPTPEFCFITRQWVEREKIVE